MNDVRLVTRWRVAIALAALSLVLSNGGCASSSRTTQGQAPAAPPARAAEVDMTSPVPAPLPAPTLTTSVPAEERVSWPHYGDSVAVDTPAEAVTKVPPSYPDAAREHGVQGTVWMQALVRTDGTVGATLVTRGHPELNAAAVAAVAQWRFQPAIAAGKPVATWQAVPVKFVLH